MKLIRNFIFMLGLIIPLIIYGNIAEASQAPTIQWERWYTVNPNTIGTMSTATQTSDGGYFLSGTTYLDSYWMDQLYWIKLDSSLNTQWTGTGGYSNGYDRCYYSMQATNGDLVVVGATHNNENVWDDLYLRRITITGTKYDAVIPNYGGVQVGYFISATNDGFIVTGYTGSAYGNSDIWLVKTNPQFGVIWTKSFGGSDSDCGYCVRQTSDGGYIIAANKGYAGDVIKTDSSGNLQWEKTISGGYCNARSVRQTSDGGYIVGGTNGFQAYLLKLNVNGDKEWDYTYAGKIGNDEGYSVIQDDDGAYVLTGYTKDQNNVASIFLIKVDNTGVLQWQEIMSRTNTFAHSLQKTSDGGYLIGGTTAGSSCIYAAKLVTPPTLTNISPTSGSTAGGTTVTITGTGFTGATAVNFGTIPGTGLTINSNTSITVTSPAGSGTVDVTVTGSGGTSETSLNDKFTYIPTGTITGRVYDSGNTPVSGANVSVTVSGNAYTAQTALDGTYTINNVPTGSGYTVTASKTGGNSGCLSNISVTTGATTSGVNIDISCPVTYRGAQKRVNTGSSTTYDVRFLATINTLDPDAVGFVFSKSEQNPTAVNVPSSQVMPTTVVYTSILAAGAPITAESLGGTGAYIIACTVTGIPEVDVGKPFYVRAFSTKGDITTYTSVKTIRVSGLL